MCASLKYFIGFLPDAFKKNKILVKSKKTLDYFLLNVYYNYIGDI
jgi:hypothetical protein